MRPLLIGFAILLGFFSEEPPADIAVIAHPDVAVDSVDVNFLSNVYTLTFQRWDDGSKITVFNYKAESPLKTAFYEFIDQKAASLRKTWLRYQLTGEGRPPKAVKSSQAMLKQVSDTEGSIGYVPYDQVTESVKIIAIIEP